MNRIRTCRTCWLGAVILFLTTTACGEEPTGPDAVDPNLTAAFAKPGGKPGGGGKPSGDISLEVDFGGEADGIRSDGLGVYVNGLDFVSAQIKSSGQFYFQTFKGKKNDDPARWVRVVVDEASTVSHEPDHLDAFKAALAEAGDSWPDFTSDVTIHTRSLNGGMIDMGTTLLDAGKIGFNDYGDESWEWRLLFGDRIETPEGGVDHYEYGLCVTRNGEGWIVTNQGNCDGHTLDGVTALWRVVGGDFIHVADFNSPMHLSLSPVER